METGVRNPHASISHLQSKPQILRLRRKLSTPNHTFDALNSKHKCRTPSPKRKGDESSCSSAASVSLGACQGWSPLPKCGAQNLHGTKQGSSTGPTEPREEETLFDGFCFISCKLPFLASSMSRNHGPSCVRGSPGCKRSVASSLQICARPVLRFVG